jgi:NodT family efflux transporter outer membrane factor (OMF) lipoprotein
MPTVTRSIQLLGLALAAGCLSGCTSPSEYIHNGFMVGPNYTGAKAAVAPQWIDAGDKRVRSDPADLSRWWGVFNDPVLNDLVYHAYMQNITLKEAGARILAARANLAIARGELFPQTQTSTGSYQRIETSANPNFPITHKFFDQWNYGFNLAWELDFWGRFRRAVIAAQDQVDFSVEDYDDALVTLIGDVASNYVTMRQTQQQIELAKANVQLQAEILKIVQARFQQGTTSELDVDQAQSTLSQTEATIPAFEITLRQSQNALCTLLGIPPMDLQACLNKGPIPAAPPEVVVGIPAQLLERRPDIRRAERSAAAASEQIGIAISDWYPHISITGTIGGSAQNASKLFTFAADTGSVGPTFTWNILNYGRILNNVRLQDANFQQQLLIYRQTVLNANQEAENGLIVYLKSHEAAQDLKESVIAANKAVKIVIAQYKVGKVDFTTVSTIEQNLVTQQNQYAISLGEIANGLVTVYRALGGGWEIRCGPNFQSPLPQPTQAPPPEEIPPIPVLDLGKTVNPGAAIPEPVPSPPAKPIPQGGI